MGIDRNTVIQWAREEGMLLPSGPYFAEYEAGTLRFATRIAQRAAEAERQACEAACTEIAHQNRKAQMLMPRQGLIAEQTAMECAGAIRARGIKGIK